MVTVSLIFIAALAWASALLQNLNHARLRGPAFVTSDRSQPVDPDGMSGRMARAFSNLIEASLMYIPSAMIAAIHGLDSIPVRWAAAGFMSARAGYAVCYWFGASKIRSALWSIGMLCTAVMIVEAFKASPAVG